MVGQVEELCDAFPPAVAGFQTHLAAHAFEEYRVPAFFEVQPGLARQVLVQGRGLAAVGTDSPHQPLRQNAVERRHKVVGIDAHVHEAADDIERIVGMDRGEYQVAGESGLNRYLRRLRVPNLAHHDLVRIVPEDGPQAARECEPLFFVDRDLHHPRQLIFHRIFDRDHLLVQRINLTDRGIQRRGLPTAGRPRDENHAVRLGDGATKALQITRIKAQPIEPQVSDARGDRFPVQNPDHHRLAEHARQDRYPEVHRLAVNAQPKSPVLWDSPLCDVQFRHHLQAGDQRSMQLRVKRLERRNENAVNSHLDQDSPIGRFNMNIAGPFLQGA